MSSRSRSRARRLGQIGRADEAQRQLRDVAVATAAVQREEQRHGVGLAQDVRQLVRAIARVEGHHDHAEAGRRVLGDEPERPVGQPDGQGVALPETESGQAAGEGARFTLSVPLA